MVKKRKPVNPKKTVVVPLFATKMTHLLVNRIEIPFSKEANNILSLGVEILIFQNGPKKVHTKFRIKVLK